MKRRIDACAVVVVLGALLTLSPVEAGGEALQASVSFTLTVYEQTGTINAYTFHENDLRLYTTVPGDPGPPWLGYIGYDIGTGGCEYYDLFFSDSLGNVLPLQPGDPLPDSLYLTIKCNDLNCNTWLPDTSPTWQGAGNNLDAVVLEYLGSTSSGEAITQTYYGLCDEPFEAKTGNFAESALGPPDGDITKMGGGISIITMRIGFVAPPPGPAVEPLILSIEDIANDQGRQVRIKWDASYYDMIGSPSPITSYAIWRRIDELPAMVQCVNTGDAGIGSDTPLMYPPGEWDYVVSIPACCEGTYATIVPTLADSTIAHGMHYSIFFVRALTGTPGIYFDSPVDSGYSVDNLAPAHPAGLQGVQVPNGLRISWEPNMEEDFSHYVLCRGTTESCINSDTLAILIETSYIDETWTPGSTFYYTLSAVDVSGNASEHARVTPEEYIATLLQVFSASTDGSGIEIVWRLSACDEGVIFFVMRAEAPHDEFEELAGARPHREGLTFTYKDTACEPGTTYRYRIEYTNDVSRCVLFETEPIATPVLPLTLYQNYPNPFNPSTAIRYHLPERAHVMLEIYDVAGRLVDRLVDGEEPRGEKAVRWDGRDRFGKDVRSGIYFYRLKVGKELVSRKMLLLR